MTQQFGGYPDPGQFGQPAPGSGYPPGHHAGPASGMSRTHILAGLSGLLGIAAFAFGFVPFYGLSSQYGVTQSINGFSTTGVAAVGLAVLAGLVGAAALWTGRGQAFGLVAAAAAVLMCIGEVLSVKVGLDRKAGGWLVLGVAVLIAAVQAVTLLEGRGSISPGGPTPAGQPPGAYPPAHTPQPYAPQPYEPQ